MTRCFQASLKGIQDRWRCLCFLKMRFILFTSPLQGKIHIEGNASDRKGEKERREGEHERRREGDKERRLAGREGEREREKERLGEKNVQVHHRGSCTTPQPHNPCFSSANQQPVTPSAAVLQLMPSHNRYHPPKGRNSLTQPCVSLV